VRLIASRRLAALMQRSITHQPDRTSGPPHPNPCMGLSKSSTILATWLSFSSPRVSRRGPGISGAKVGGNAIVGEPAKRKRALLGSNPRRNSWSETHSDATGADEHRSSALSLMS